FEDPRADALKPDRQVRAEREAPGVASVRDGADPAADEGPRAADREVREPLEASEPLPCDALSHVLSRGAKLGALSERALEELVELPIDALGIERARLRHVGFDGAIHEDVEEALRGGDLGFEGQDIVRKPPELDLGA